MNTHKIKINRENLTFSEAIKIASEGSHGKYFEQKSASLTDHGNLPNYYLIDDTNRIRHAGQLDKELSASKIAELSNYDSWYVFDLVEETDDPKVFTASAAGSTTTILTKTFVPLGALVRCTSGTTSNIGRCLKVTSRVYTTSTWQYTLTLCGVSPGYRSYFPSATAAGDTFKYSTQEFSSLTQEIKDEISKEVDAQISKLLDFRTSVYASTLSNTSPYSNIGEVKIALL